MKPVHHTLTNPEEAITFLVHPQDVHYKYTKLLCTVQPGVAVGPHKHPKLTETFRLLSGRTATILIEGKAQHLKPNDPVATTVLPNVVHEWVNNTDGPLTFEVVFYPLSGQSLQEINLIGAFTSYFALRNEYHESARLLHKLRTMLKLAVSEYTFRNVSVSVSLITRVQVFLLAQVGRLLGLKPHFDEA